MTITEVRKNAAPAFCSCICARRACADGAAGGGAGRRDDRSGALPHDRSRRRDASHAGGFLHPADLAGKQLRPGVTSRAGAQGARSSCPGPPPSAGSPIRSIPNRRSRNPPSCSTTCGGASAISGWQRLPTMAGRRGSRPGSRDAAACHRKRATTCRHHRPQCGRLGRRGAPHRTAAATRRDGNALPGAGRGIPPRPRAARGHGL